MLPKNTQVALFSATFPPPVRAFAEKVAPAANKLTLRQEELSVDGIKQLYMNCQDEAHKFEVLVALYGLLTIGQSIIFVNVGVSWRMGSLRAQIRLTIAFSTVQRRDVADKIANEMTAQGHKVISLHGAFDATQRDNVMDLFRSGKAKVLITTNVLARGIDILMVS